MKRLREERGSSDPAIARMARLLEAMETPPPSEVPLRRVAAALAKRRGSRVTPRVLRFASAMAVLLCLITVAAASSALRARIRHAVDLLLSSSPAPRAVQEPTRSVEPNAHVAPPSPTPPPSTPPEPAEPTEVPAAVPEQPAPRPDGVRTSPRRRASRAAPAAAPSVALAETVRAVAPGRMETRPLLSAVNALRGDPPNPDDAAMLLSYYRQHFPDGALAEEALALAVEAEWRRGSDKVAVHANQYEARYPQGRYLREVRSMAESARSGR